MTLSGDAGASSGDQPVQWTELDRGERLHWLAQTHRLTPRETEVIEHVAQGRRNSEIARTIEKSIHDVKFHLSNAFRKLGIRSRHEVEWLLR